MSEHGSTSGSTPGNDQVGGDIAVELQRLLIGAAGVESFLVDVARRATGAVGNALSCGVTVGATRNTPVFGAASDEIGRVLDGVQYAVDDGPCLTSVRTGRTVRVTDIVADPRWEAFSRRARQAGAGSSVSVPLVVDDEAVGALNLYSAVAHGLTDDDERRAHQFAEQAAGAVALARRLRDREDRARHLETALLSRSSIDQAIGIIIARTGVGPDEAFGLLRVQSQHTNEKLREVAQRIVVQAVRTT